MKQLKVHDNHRCIVLQNKGHDELMCECGVTIKVTFKGVRLEEDDGTG